jgi:hypothetical protein
MIEIWKSVKNYEGAYEVSNFGNVRTIKKQVQVLKPYKHHYYNVKLYKDGKATNHSIHQLVAIAFLNHEPSKHKVVVDHINEDKFDNRLENLQLISHRENLSRSKKNKSSKYTGVRKKYNKFEAQATVGNKTFYLGRFECEYEAHLKYINFIKSLNY